MYLLTLLTLTVVVAIGTTVGKRIELPKRLTDVFEVKMKNIKQMLPDNEKFKIVRLDDQVKKFQKKLKEVNKVVTKEVESTEKLSSAITGIGSSAVKLASGYVNGKWQDMVVGVLGIIGGLAALTGPMGALLSSVLSIISVVIGCFGGSQKAEESQESMLKRVITEAFDKTRAEELKADAEGLKNLMLSIRTSVNQFRESKSVSKEQANEMYTQVFTGLDFFGKLKYEINKFCDISIDDPSPDDLKIYVEKADKCLVFLNLYSDLSIYRMYLIIDMASLFSMVSLPDAAKNLLSLCEKERILDKEIFMFLSDPINNHRRRFCVTQYHAAPSKYKTIMVYSNLLHTIPNKKNPPKDVVVCSGHALLGVCFTLDLKERSENGFTYYNTDISSWIKDGFKSMYISDTLVVTGYSQENYEAEIYGPFYGPTVVAVINMPWKSIFVLKTNKGSQEMVRVCKEKNFYLGKACHQWDIGAYPDLLFYSKLFGNQINAIAIDEDAWFKPIIEKHHCEFPFEYKDKQYIKCINEDEPNNRYWCAIKRESNTNKIIEKGYCIPSEEVKTTEDPNIVCEFPFKLNKIWYVNCNKNGMCGEGSCLLEQSYDEKIQSISIPDNLVIQIFTETGFKGSSYMLLGPNLINDFCQKAITKSMKIAHHDLEVSNLVMICRGIFLSSQCEYLLKSEYSTMHINGCSYSKENKTKSMFIPNNVKVEMWTEKDFKGMKLGPYVGPLKLDAIEGVKSRYSIESLKITGCFYKHFLIEDYI